MIKNNIANLKFSRLSSPITKRCLLVSLTDWIKTSRNTSQRKKIICQTQKTPDKQNAQAERIKDSSTNTKCQLSNKMHWNSFWNNHHAERTFNLQMEDFR